MTEDDEPKFDYEGEGFIRNKEFIINPENQNKYDFEFIVIRIPEGKTYVIGGKYDKPENYLITFKGNITRKRQDGIDISGILHSHVKGRLQFVKMVNEKNGLNNEFPEIDFKKGNNNIDFQGKITGWVKDDSMEK